jgi:hypothetical protein
MMDIVEVLSEVRWRPEISDPYTLAWATVVAYLVAAWGCGLCAFRAKQIFGNRDVNLHRAIWWFMCAVLLFLGINKQLDFQMLFTQVIKILAHRWDIYELGKRSQKYFVLALAVVSIGGLTWIAWRIRHAWRLYIVLIAGALFIIRFVIVRVGTFYGVSLPQLSSLTGGFKLNWLAEISGALLIAAGAFLNVKLFAHRRDQQNRGKAKQGY